jgi:hypothetical protein
MPCRGIFLCFALSLFVLATSLKSPKRYFGFYDADISTTAPFSNIFQASSLESALAAHAAGLQSLLLVYDTFFMGAPSRTILIPNWEARWAAQAAEVAPFISNGTLLGFNLGDELVWNCLAPANLSIVANAVRARYPHGSAIVWYNEATAPLSAGMDSCGHVFSDYVVPAALDWFSTDVYHMDGLQAGWVAKWVRGFYDAHVFPRLAPGQQAVLVPGSFGSDVNHYPNGTYVCNRSCYDQMCAYDAADFTAWALADTRVVGVFPWTWAGCPTCNGSRWTPPHTCCMDELGTRVQPVTRATWARLGPTIFGN